MRRALMAILCVACGGGEGAVREEPEPVVVREAPPPEPEHPGCPPVACMGPEASEDDALARAHRSAREQLYRDQGGEGPIPEGAARARWLGPAESVSAGRIDLARAAAVEGLATPSPRPGAAAFLALHTERGWYVCEAGRRAGRVGAPSVSVIEGPSAQALSRQAPPGVTLAVRVVDRGPGERRAEIVERTAVCADGADRPACHAVIETGRGEVTWSDGEDRPTEAPSALSVRYGGDGTVTLERARGDDEALVRQVGAHPVRGLRCALDP